MYWYNIKRISEGYIVVKTVELNNSIGSTRKFIGTKKDCINFCEKNNIILNSRRKIKHG